LFGAGVDDSEDGRIYRRATSAQARDALERQFRFLPKMRELLPFPVPAPEVMVDDVLVYPKLPGAPMPPDAYARFDSQELASDIAEFMGALHGLPVQDCLAWGVSGRDRTEGLLCAFDRTLPALSSADRQSAEAWRSGFNPREYRSVVIHGDLWYENILIDPHTHRLVGVIDFESTTLGDPAWDLATQLHCGEEFARLVFEAYRHKDSGMWNRSQQLFQLRQFEGLDWAVRHGDAAEFADSIEKLRLVGVLRRKGDA
jgi:aminoglycoside 2''-phosphotransferase